MATPKVILLRTAGINCDREAQFAWELAGAQADLVHIGRVIEQPRTLDSYQIITIPGGFSYGDDIAAGRIFAAQIERHLIAEFRQFIASGRLVIGICNGFQILVKAGLLPFSQSADGWRDCTIAHNDPPEFQDRWTCARAESDRCAFLESGQSYEFPIAHGEGRVTFSSDTVAQRVMAGGHAVLRYTNPPTAWDKTGRRTNPNGSAHDIAGMCDETGRVFGLMPHPERFVQWTQHPCWTSLPERAEGDGLAIFRRAVKYFA